MLLCANSCSCVLQQPQRSPRHHRSVQLLPLAPAAQPHSPVSWPAAVAQQRSSSTAENTTSDTHFYRWPGRGSRRDHDIAFSTTGSGPVPLVLVHAFGTCRSSWAKLLAELDGTRYTAYAIDLLGFGDSDKPPLGDEVVSAPPGSSSSGSSSTDPGHLYSFQTWASQLRDFVEDVVQQPAILMGNSAGGLAALQAAVDAPGMTRGLVLLDCSLRNMHERKQPPLLAPFIAAWQWAVTSTPLGRAVVTAVLHQPAILRAILASAYGDADALSPELVASVTRHLQHPTSAAVILDVLSNPRGVLPEDLLPLCTVPVIVLWGSDDPWEPVSTAEAVFSGYCADFVVLPGVGHFPQDEVPALICSMLDHFADECAVELEAEGGAAAAASAAACRGAQDGDVVGGFSLRGLMAAAELDAKV